jgi:26S proteasome regulatory subunit N6
MPAAQMEVDDDSSLTPVQLAAEFEAKEPERAIAAYRALIFVARSSASVVSAAEARAQEAAITALANFYVHLKRPEEVGKLLRDIRPLFVTMAKARTAKITRSLLDTVAGSDLSLQISLAEDVVAWARTEKRTFLRQRIEARLAELLVERGDYKAALTLCTRLMRELKKLDAKVVIVELALVEARAHLLTRNVPKARGAVTTARSAAASVYIPVHLQARVDALAGELSASENEWATAFSYFFEALNAYDVLNNTAQATRSICYMALSKIMSGQRSEVNALFASKHGIKYAGPEIAAFRAIADAHKDKSIHQFKDALAAGKKFLEDDPFVRQHVAELCRKMLQENLKKVISVFSRVQLQHVADIIKLPLHDVERELSAMILDGVINATLDQGSGVLVIFDDVPANATYTAALDTIGELGGVVDKLQARAVKLL